MKDALRAAGRVLLGTLFPPACLGCADPLPLDPALDRELSNPAAPTTELDLWLCPTCAPHTARVQIPRCHRCALQLPLYLDRPDSKTVEVCDTCRHNPPPWAEARAAFEYGGPIAKAIHRLKSSRDRSLVPGLAALLADHLHRRDPPRLDLTPDLLVVPAPLHESRARIRGFNQAQLIAHKLAARLSLSPPVLALRRTREVEPQRDLDRAARLTNLRGVFEAAPDLDLEGKKVVFVDDVMTTGATAQEASRALSAAGAEIVLVVAVARR